MDKLTEFQTALDEAKAELKKAAIVAVIAVNEPLQG